MQCLVGHGQLWGWRGTQGSQKSWLGKMPESPSPVLGAEAVRGARELGYIIRGLADAPNPEGRGAERVNNLKV